MLLKIWVPFSLELISFAFSLSAFPSYWYVVLGLLQTDEGSINPAPVRHGSHTQFGRRFHWLCEVPQVCLWILGRHPCSEVSLGFGGGQGVGMTFPFSWRDTAGCGCCQPQPHHELSVRLGKVAPSLWGVLSLSCSKGRRLGCSTTEFCSTAWRLWPHLVSYFL